jgi:hypothetical protein
LHSAIIGKEIPAVLILLNFEKYLRDPFDSEEVQNLKYELLRSTNRLLNTPLMLCVQSEKIELLIYLLYKFENFYKSGGLQCKDIEGNNLLHLAAQSSMSLYLFQILKKFDEDKFKILIN